MRKMQKDTRLNSQRILKYGLPLAAAVLLDRISKILVLGHLKNDSVTVIDGVLDFRYVENKGSAFGMFSSIPIIPIVFSLIFCAGITVFVFRAKEMRTAYVVLLGFIAGGGIGNLIDKLAFGYVVDFIDFRMFSFWRWVFNVADSFVCVCVVLFFILYVSGEIKLEKDKRRKRENKADGQSR